MNQQQAIIHDRAQIRDDFIRRLFAVAISVGFATSLVQMKWIENVSFPAFQEKEQLCILATGLFATVLSWDGYLMSIAKKPLHGTLRFWIDILLVFIYMFLLISSKSPEYWLPVLAVIFILYVIWDALTVREHMGEYDRSLIPDHLDQTYRASLAKVLKVYVRGILNDPNTNRGPVITLVWTFLFLGLAVMNSQKAPFQVFVMCPIAIAGLVFYRYDKVVQTGFANVRGFTMGIRLILAGYLYLFAAFYFHVLSGT